MVGFLFESKHVSSKDISGKTAPYKIFICPKMTKKRQAVTLF